MSKSSVLAGWSLFLLLLFVSVFSFIAGLGTQYAAGTVPYLIHGASELLTYSAATAIVLRFIPPRKKFNLRRRPVDRMYAVFLLTASLAAAILVFLVYYFTILPFGGAVNGIFDQYPTGGAPNGKQFLLAVVTLAVIPAITNELFLRGTVFPLYESYGTVAAWLLSSAVTAMFVPSAKLVLPALTAGLICGYISYVTGSYRASAIVRFAIRLYGLVIAFAATHISPGSHWRYFIAGNTAVFFLLAFFAFRSLQDLTRDGMIPHFEEGSGTLGKNLKDGVKNAGFLLFTLLFFIRIAVNFLTITLR